MSSQIIRTTSHRRRSSVELISAGDTQNVTCAPIVYLEATVNGDLTGHPVEWVQISGTPTVTLEPGGTPLQTFYTVAVGQNGSDKVFRCYVDRNTQIEQYRDVSIRTTPRSFAFTTEHGVLNNQVPLPSGAYSTELVFVMVADFAFTIAPFANEGRLVNDQVSLTWSPPLFTLASDSAERTRWLAGYAGSVLQEWTGSTWVDIASYGATDARTYVLTNDKRLRQGNLFTLGFAAPVTAYNPWVDLSLTSSGAALVGKEVMATVEHGVLGVTPSISRIVYRLESLGATDAASDVVHGVLANTVNTVRIVYTLQDQAGSSDAMTTTHGVLNNIIAITRISGGVIGG